MYIFTSLGDRDYFREANEGDKCRVGNKKYVYSGNSQWREIVDIITLENESVVSSGCGCGNCGC